MKTSLNLFALRSLAVLTAATALMSSANASTPRGQTARLTATAPIVSSAGTTVFNPDAASIETSGTSS